MTLSTLDERRATRQVRRAELATFLKSRRARITPESVGLPPGPRRRTPGLRREEVAQLSGIGITWYTWLEQGRPINVSVQVLEAVARTLSLDTAEKAHLYRLADIPTVPSASEEGELPGELQTILDQLDPLPAVVLSGRYDLLAWNEAYSTLFPHSLAGERNTLWEIFATPDCCTGFADRSQHVARMVAYLRSTYAKHLNDPSWTDFIERLSAASDEFAQMWARNDVALPSNTSRVYRHGAIGQVALEATGFTLPSPAGAWMKVFTPADDASREALVRLRSMSEEERRAPALQHIREHHSA